MVLHKICISLVNWCKYVTDQKLQQEKHNLPLACTSFADFCRAMLRISATYAVVRCLPVCLFVTFVYSV